MDPVSAIANGISSIFNNLGSLGVGSKSRKSEQRASVEAAEDVANIEARSKSRQLQNIVVIIVVVFALAITGIIVFKKLKS